MNSKSLNNDIPSNFKVIKPWGFEYTIYKNSVSSTKLLKISPNSKTSLHCHPIKKTGFVLLKGKVDVDLGFYETRSLKPITKLMIRQGLFHCTKNTSSDYATVLEIETPIDKDDLVRFKDDYGRENKPYEGQEQMLPITEKDITFKEPDMNSFNEYNLEGVNINITKINNIQNFKKGNKNDIFVILKGGLYSDNKQRVLSPGDIVRTDTIVKLSENFNIIDNLTYLNILQE
jgi:mannose-6-phosphate isomerase-like protein (cupin superfamily)